MEMSFTVGKSEARLVGLGHVEGKEVGSRGVNKILQKNNGKGMLLQIRLWDENEKEGGEEWEPWVRQYPTVFGEIKGLPMKRSQDHHIPLLPEMGPVSMKPYRYPYYQK